MAITHDTGIDQYLKYGTASANTWAGRVTGGELRADSSHVWRPAIGGNYAEGRGIWNGGGSATIEVANATLISYALRSAFTCPTLTELYFEGGAGCSLGNNEGFTQSGCWINTLELSLSVGEPLTATIGWVAMAQAQAATPTWPNSENDTHFEWFEGQCTFNGSTYGMQSMTINVNNNVEPISDIETKGAGYLVLPDDLKIGPEEVTMSAEMLTWPGTTAWGLEQDAGITGLGATMVAVSGGKTITITLANVSGTAVRMPFSDPNTPVRWAFEGSCKPNTANSITIAYA